MKLPDRYSRVNLVATALVLAGLALWIDPAEMPTDGSRFAGRLHPMLVHFPIGILFVVALLDLARRWLPSPQEWLWRGYVLGGWTALASVAAGLWQAQAGGYDPDLLFWHRIAGILTALFAAAAAFVASLTEARTAHPAAGRILAVMILACLVVGGHEGASLTHGPGYLAAHAPAFAREWLGGRPADARPSLENPATVAVYEGIVAPILDARCIACHREGRARSRLRLDSPEGIEAGSDEGPVVVAGRPAESELVRRILLPDTHRRRMPPRDATPLSASDARLLVWWIQEGASFERTLAETDLPPEVTAILEARGMGEVRTGIWALDVPEADSSAMETLRSLGAVVTRIADGDPFVQVRCGTRLACFADGGAALRDLAPQVAWLDAARSDITDADVALLAALPHLEKLWLQKTAITGMTLGDLGGSVHLSYLNVTETGVTTEALAPLGHVADVYTWGSPAAGQDPE